MHSTRMYILAGLMAALDCVLAQLAIPIGPVPITLQVFAIAFSGALLGAWPAFLSVIVYLLLGACGLPVFAGFTGGIGVFWGMTGGFLYGFPFLAALCGLTRKKSVFWQLTAGIFGLIIVYLAGAAHLSWVAGIDFSKALATGVIPFVIKDVISVLAAILLSRTVNRRIKISVS